MGGYISAQYINEFHYTNDGSDEGEFIEILIDSPPPMDLIPYRIYIYNGLDSMILYSRSLSGITPNCGPNSCFYVWQRQSTLLQNETEAIALVYEGETDTIIYDFISYEGEILAKDGPLVGMTSTDVGVMEDNSTEVGWSLQLDSTGTWVAGPATPGSINPIELLTFTGQYREDEGGVLLEWVTASELNTDHFELQSSVDQRLFISIATIVGAINSQDTISYSYFDPEPYPDLSYYRLKQVDLDGRYQFSSVIEVQCPASNSLKDLVPVFHNQTLSFMQSGYRDFLDVTIYDSLGRKLAYRENIHARDVIPLHTSPSGIIFYLIQSQGQSHAGPVVVLGGN